MKLTETREFEDFVVKMARECDGASTALGRETLGRETCAAARALLSALDREKAKPEPPEQFHLCRCGHSRKTHWDHQYRECSAVACSCLRFVRAKPEPPKVISCRKCHTLRAFGDDYCMCGERSWYVARTEPPNRCVSCGKEWTHDSVWCPRCHTDKSIEPKRTAEEMLESIPRLARHLDREGWSDWQQICDRIYEALPLVAELRAERDELKRRIEKAKATCSSWTTSNAFDKISEMHRILRGEK